MGFRICHCIYEIWHYIFSFCADVYLCWGWGCFCVILFAFFGLHFFWWFLEFSIKLTNYLAFIYNCVILLFHVAFLRFYSFNWTFGLSLDLMLIHTFNECKEEHINDLHKNAMDRNFFWFFFSWSWSNWRKKLRKIKVSD